MEIMEEILYQMVKTFCIQNGREPKIIILSYNKWGEFIRLSKSIYMDMYMDKYFMMCKVIMSNNIESIELY